MQNLTARLSIVAALAGWACAGAPQLDMAAEVASLRAVVDEYHRAASALDTDGVVAFYAADAVTLPPCGERVDGIEGMRGFAEAFTSVPGLKLTFMPVHVAVSESGDMAYTLATGDLTMNGPDGSTLQERVRDVHVWRKVDGAWKVVLDVWNSPAPLPCPEM